MGRWRRRTWIRAEKEDVESCWAARKDMADIKLHHEEVVEEEPVSVASTGRVGIASGGAWGWGGCGHEGSSKEERVEGTE